MGTPANSAVRAARQAAHAAFDPIWQRGDLSRGAAYHWLAQELGIPVAACHIGRFNAAQCDRVIALCKPEGTDHEA